jgi:hypothetical protein
MTTPALDQSPDSPKGFTAQIIDYLIAEQPEHNFLVNTPAQVGGVTFENALRDAIIHCGFVIGHGKPVLERFSVDDQSLILGVYDDWRNTIVSHPKYRENLQFCDFTEKDLFADLLKYSGTTEITKELSSRIVKDPSFAGRLLGYAESFNKSKRFIYEWFSLTGAKSSSSVEAYLDLFELLVEAAPNKLEGTKLFPKLSEYKTADQKAIKDAVILGLLKRPMLFKSAYNGEKVVGPIFMATRNITDLKTACGNGLFRHFKAYVDGNLPDLFDAIASMSKDDAEKTGVGFWSNNASEADLLIRKATSYGISSGEIDQFLSAFAKLVDPELAKSELEGLTPYEKIVACDYVPVSVLKHIVASGRKQGLYSNDDILSAKGDELRKYEIAADYFSVQDFIEQNKKDIADEFLAQDLGL